jgi:hypothetical protein
MHGHKSRLRHNPWWLSSLKLLSSSGIGLHLRFLAKVKFIVGFLASGCLWPAVTPCEIRYSWMVPDPFALYAFMSNAAI